MNIAPALEPLEDRLLPHCAVGSVEVLPAPGPVSALVFNACNQEAWVEGARDSVFGNMIGKPALQDWPGGGNIFLHLSTYLPAFHRIELPLGDVVTGTHGRTTW